jgi:hypothetical protein
LQLREKVLSLRLDWHAALLLVAGFFLGSAGWRYGKAFCSGLENYGCSCLTIWSNLDECAAGKWRRLLGCAERKMKIGWCEIAEVKHF